MIGSVMDNEGAPVEVAPGRGNLRRSSVPASMSQMDRELRLVDRTVSYARLYAEQGMVGMVISWFLRQSIRVPLRAYRRESDESRKPLVPGDHPVADALASPWEGGSPADLTHATLGPFLVQGNALTELESGARNRLRFRYCDWRWAWPIMSGADIVGWELDRSLAIERERARDVVMHIANWSPLGQIGLSPLQQLGVSIGIDDAAQRWQRALWRNGARPPSAIVADEEFLGLDPEERKEIEANLRHDVNELYTGPESAGRPAFLPPGLDWKPVGHTAVEAALIDQRVVSRQEAIGIYGLMPGAVGIFERTPELEQQRIQAIQFGLAPPLIFIEQKINTSVCRDLLKEPDIEVEYDFSAILRGDPLKEIERIRESIATGVMTPKEGRQDLGKPTDNLPPQAEELYLPFNNLWPIGQPPPEGRQGRPLQQAIPGPEPTQTPSGLLVVQH